MNTHRILRRSSAFSALIAGTFLVPAALEAGCMISNNPVTKVETYTCCGETACCTTRWQGATLIYNSCRG